MLYQSMKLTNGIWVLAELRVQAGNPNYAVSTLFRAVLFNHVGYGHVAFSSAQLHVYSFDALLMRTQTLDNKGVYLHLGPLLKLL